MASVHPRRLSTGEIAWRVMGRAGGKQVQKSFVKEDDADAFKRLADRLGWSNAVTTWERREGRAEPLTLRDWTRKYLDRESGILTGIEPMTRKRYLSMAERSFLTYLGDVPLDTLQREDVGAWIEWQAEQTHKSPRGHNKPKMYSSKTIKNMHSVLSAALEAANQRDLIHKNVAKGAPIPQGLKEEPVFLSKADYFKLYEAMDDRFKGFVEFLVSSQCRFSEATALAWGHVNTDSEPPTVNIVRAWKLTGEGRKKKLGPPKTRMGRRTIALWDDVIEKMGPRGDRDEFVFTAVQGGPIDQANFYERYWTPAVKRAGIDPTTSPHDLRHTGASWLIADGVPLTFIQRRLGHESIQTTSDTYGHLLPDAHTRMAASLQGTLTRVGFELPAVGSAG